MHYSLYGDFGHTKVGEGTEARHEREHEEAGSYRDLRGYNGPTFGFCLDGAVEFVADSFAYEFLRLFTVVCDNDLTCQTLQLELRALVLLLLNWTCKGLQVSFY